MDLLSISQAARELHCAPRILRRAVRNGELKAYRFGERTLRVERRKLYEWVEGTKVPTWRDHNGKA